MRRSHVSVYLQATLLVAVLTWVKLQVPAIGQRLPFLLYFGVVLFAAWRGGRAPAAVAILGSVIAVNSFFLAPRMALLQSALFVAEGAVIAEVCEVMRRSRCDSFEAASRLDTTLRSIGDAVIATDIDGRIVFMNPVAAEITGVSEDDAKGKMLEDVFVAVDETTRQQIEGPVPRVLREGKAVGLTNHTVVVARGAKDGAEKTETPIDCSGAPIRDSSGGVSGVVLVFRDVGREKRRNMQRDLLAEVTSTLAGSLDVDNTLAQVAKLLVPRLADRCAFEIVTDGGGGSEQPAVAEDAEHLRIARELALPSALTVPLIARGKTLGALTMVYAESGRRYSEADLAFAQQLADRAALAVDNARLYSQERAARETADAAMRLKDEFLATLSHELRTPLTAVLGWSRLLADGSLDASKQGKAIATVERNAGLMAQLVDDLLDVSRIISGKLRIETQPTALAPIVDAAIESVKPAAQAKDIIVTITLGDKGPLMGDARRLQQIAWNLLSNAVKFTPRGGRVEVTIARKGSFIELCVSDTGRGFDPDFLPFAFDRFRQQDASFTRAAGGLGLGLAITRHLVDLHGGTIEVSSEGKDRGTRFLVRFPIAAERD